MSDDTRRQRASHHNSQKTFVSQLESYSKKIAELERQKSERIDTIDKFRKHLRKLEEALAQQKEILTRAGGEDGARERENLKREKKVLLI